MKKFFIVIPLLLGMILLGMTLEIVGIHYPRVIENQPLRDPVRVSSVDGKKLTLEDGRVFHLEHTPIAGWKTSLAETRSFIDLEPDGEEGVRIYGNKKGWVCGTPWARLIRIPLIPVNTYRNKRELIGFGAQINAAPPNQDIENP